MQYSCIFFSYFYLSSFSPVYTVNKEEIKKIHIDYFKNQALNFIDNFFYICKKYQMDKNSKIYIAGHRGLVGSAIYRKLQVKEYTHFCFTPHSEYDLTNQNVVNHFFETEKPEYVVLAAAKVGGIWANNVYRAQFIYENLQIQNNIIHAAYSQGVKKLLFLGSSCIYPKNTPQPMKEDHLLTDILEYTNEPYALAKIAGIKMCESYNLQYGTNFIAVMPTNLFGENDNFDLEKSHVLPALIRKMHLAKLLKGRREAELRADLDKYPIETITGKSEWENITNILAKYGIKSQQVELWGSGLPRREFLHSDDLADACAYLLENIDFKDIVADQFKVQFDHFPYTGVEIRNTHLNIGIGKDLSIQELAGIIKQIVAYDGSIVWNSDKPDGTMQKLLDVSQMEKLGWKAQIPFKEGIAKVYKQYISPVLKGEFASKSVGRIH